MATFCSKCGTPLEEGAGFCPSCGKQGAGGPPGKKKRPLIVTCLGCGCASMVGFALLIGVIVLFGISAMSKLAKEDYYTIGNDKVPTVKLALGEERKVTGLSASVVAGGATTKVITYQVPGTEQGREMFKYYTYLHDKDGFLPLADFDFSGPTGTGVIARNSVDAGQMVHLKIEYNTGGYTITLTKLQGEVTPKAPAGDTTPEE